MALPGNLGRTTQCNVNLILSSCFLKNNSFQGLGGCSGRCPGTSRNILTAQKTKLSAITGQLLARVLQGHSGWGKPSHRPGPRSASTAVPPLLLWPLPHLCAPSVPHRPSDAACHLESRALPGAPCWSTHAAIGAKRELRLPGRAAGEGSCP